MKKQFFLLLTACFAFWASAQAQSFDYTYEGVTLKYEIIDGGVQTAAADADESIFKLDENNGGVDRGSGPNFDKSQVIVIPSQVQYNGTYFPVVGIGRGSFAGKDGQFESLTVTLPASCKFIDAGAFAGTKITDINFGGVTKIGDNAFSKCEKLTELEIPSGIETLGANSFAFCSQLSKLTIGEGVTAVGNGAFKKCGLRDVTFLCKTDWINDDMFTDSMNNLDSLTIGGVATSMPSCNAFNNTKAISLKGNVSVIPQYAFSGFNQLQKVEIDCAVSEIPAYLFQGKNGLQSVTLAGAITKIGERAFDNCSSIKELVLGENIEEIGDFAFNNCQGLQDLELNSVKRIGQHAFENCTNIQKIVLGENIESIGQQAFNGCTGITDLTINGPKDFDISVFSGLSKDKLASLTIGGVVESVPDGAFKDFTGLQKLSIDGNVKSIGASAFEGCITIKDLTFGSNLVSIGDMAFKDCKAVPSITIPGNVKTIGESAFEGCLDLANLTIGEGVESIGDSAFKNCSNSSFNTLTIPATVRNIGTAAFKGCTNISQLNLKSGVKCEIGDSAFYALSSLSELTIPQTVTKIGKAAFMNCANLTSLNMFGDVKNIEEYAFADCQTLNTVVISDFVKTIETSAFRKCQSLANLILGENIVTIADSAFYDCQSLRCLTIPNSVIRILDYAFYNINGLDANCFTVGNSLEWIGNYSFYDARVTELELPASLKHIGDMAFDMESTYSGDAGEHNGSYLTHMYVHAKTPPEIDEDENSFGDTETEKDNYARGHWIYQTVCLHVPQGTRQSYKEAKGWRHFQCIIDDLVDVNKSVEEIEIIGYVFIIPGEKINLVSDEVIELPDDDADWTWSGSDGVYFETSNSEGNENQQDSESKVNPNDDRNVIITLDKDGNVVGKHFGQALALVYRNDGNQIWAGDGYKDVEPTLAGCVVVFVCPTVTLVYNNADPAVVGDDKQTESASVNLLSVSDKMDGSENHIVSDLVTSNVTYEHRVVYNSLPKLLVEPVDGIKIEAISRGEMDEYGVPTEQYKEELEGVTYASDNTSIVPTDPISNNRIIAIQTLAVDRSGTVGCETVELDGGISVSVEFHTITIHGAADDELVRVYSVNGRTVESTTRKTFEIADPGIYVITVGDAAFKAIVR